MVGGDPVRAEPGGRRSLRIVAKITTGARPARIDTAILPLDRVNTVGRR
jgi:hypothetical protein